MKSIPLVRGHHLKTCFTYLQETVHSVDSCDTILHDIIWIQWPQRIHPELDPQAKLLVMVPSLKFGWDSEHPASAGAVRPGPLRELGCSEERT